MKPETAEWLNTLDDRLHAKLAGFRVATPRERTRATLRMLHEKFLATKTVKPATLAVYKQARESLEGYFGVDRLLADITPFEAEKWRKAMVDDKFATATIAKRVHVAKQVFKRAVKWGMVPQNPFVEVKAGSQANPARAFFVPRDVVAKVMEKCPDDQWRTIVALCRYAGLRCPSEILGLRWADVLWDANRMVVRSPKTAGHEGKEQRVVPLVPELRPLLLALFHAAEPGEEHVITRYRLANTNLRTQLRKIIARAGQTVWPRLFHNLRASCATEMVQKHPAHVVGAWLGHTVAVAEKHYLQVRDSDFERAAGVDSGSPKGDVSATQKATNEATKKATNHQTSPNLTERHKSPEGLETQHEMQLCEVPCGSVQEEKWAILDSNQ